ncbi:hypothetical protein WJX84_003115 [Apatococcus fuscideae]|uniref:tRNA-dihydrouridine(16/17) synthase [NAD(P)(+)] n=1 Tax=Apatococcus fuscideae TaxID=2026836 RepID=A0AAW1SUR3_9CHLO
MQCASQNHSVNAICRGPPAAQSLVKSSHRSQRPALVKQQQFHALLPCTRLHAQQEDEQGKPTDESSSSSSSSNSTLELLSLLVNNPSEIINGSEGEDTAENAAVQPSESKQEAKESPGTSEAGLYAPPLAQPRVTYVLLGLNLLVYLAGIGIALRVGGEASNQWFLSLAKSNQALQNGEIWRLGTSVFMHAGLLHLGLNTLALAQLGPEAEAVLGPQSFLTIYLLSGLSGSVASFITSPRLVTVGASGAIFGLLGAIAAYLVKNRQQLTNSNRQLVNILGIVAANVLLGLGGGNIDNAGHIGGLAAGLILGPQTSRHLLTSRLKLEDLLDMPQAVVPAGSVERAWEFFRKIGSPKFHVAPMVDQSELAFRLLCRRHGATAAYTPMLHSRLSVDSPKYLEEHFTTCKIDRPLFAQFCANDPPTLLRAAQLVQGRCDAVDINLGCPQRIARKGRYGAFLMDDLPLIERLVSVLATSLEVPVTCKIRIFPELQRTLEYARMLQAAGCSILAVHGRTRQQKRASETRADWDSIKAVREAVDIPVLANGNVQNLADVHACMEYTGAVGVMSAEALLEDPALFRPSRLNPDGAKSPTEGCELLLEYLDLAESYTTPFRMIRGHAFSLLGDWLTEFTDLRDSMNDYGLDEARLKAIAGEMRQRILGLDRTYPIPKLSARQLARLEAEESKQAAQEEQQRETDALQELESKRDGAVAAASV